MLKFIYEIKVSLPAGLSLLTLLSNITTIVTDFVVFGVCLYSVWDTWKLKRAVDLQRKDDLVSILLRQSKLHLPLPSKRPAG